MTAATPVQLPQWVRDIPGLAWIRTLGLAGLLFAGSIVGAVLVVVMVPPALRSELATTSGPDLGSQWFPAIFQLLAMGYLSPADIGLQGVDFSEDLGAAGTFFAVPVVVPLLGLLAVKLFGRHVGRGVAAPNWLSRLVLAIAGGLGFSVVVTVLAALTSVRIGDPSLVLTIRAVSVIGFFAATAIAGAVVYVNFLLPGGGHARRVARAAATTIGEHLGSLALVIGVVTVIVLGVRSRDPSLLLATPLVLPWAGLAGLGVIHLVPLNVSASLAQDLGDQSVITLFSDDFPGWLWPVALIAVLVWILITSIRWRARRGLPDSSAGGWTVLLAGYLAGGVAVFIGSMLTATISVVVFASISGRLSVVLAGWGILVFALLGLVIEVVSRFVVVPMVRTLPAGLYAVLTYGIPDQPVAPSGGTAGPIEGGAGPAPVPVGWVVQESGSTAQQPAPGSTVAAAGTAVPAGTRTISAKAKRRWIAGGIVAAVIVALVIAGSIVLNVLGKGTFGPQHKVEAYLQALVDGKADRAIELLDPNVTDNQRVLLTDEIYGKAKNRPTSYEIRSTETYEGGAYVDARITQDGKSYPVTFTLSEHGKQAVFFDDWEMDGGFEVARVVYYQGTDQLTVNGIAVATQALNSSDNPDIAMDMDDEALQSMLATDGLPVLPGTYEFAAPGGSKYVTYGDDITVEVTPEGMADNSSSLIGFRKAYTDTVITDATQQLMDAIEPCTTDDVIRISDCEAASWEDTSWAAIQNIERSWATSPTVRVVSVDGDDAYSYDTEQADASQLTGQLSAVIDDSYIDVTYEVRDSEDEDWFDSSDSYDPFEVDWEATQFPITISGDELSVDLSALDTYHSDWLRPEHR